MNRVDPQALAEALGADITHAEELVPSTAPITD